MKSPIQCLEKCHQTIDKITEFNGQVIAWLTLLMMVVTCGVVFMRYVLELNSIAMQESINYLHAGLFLMGIAYTLKRGGHVRVDIFYRQLSIKNRAWVDVLGGVLFLLPVALLILVFCWDYVLSSWAVHESSKEPNGLPWVYLLKTLLLVMPVSLILQGVSEIIRNILVIRGFEPPPAEVSNEGMI